MSILESNILENKEIKKSVITNAKKVIYLIKERTENILKEYYKCESIDNITFPVDIEGIIKNQNIIVSEISPEDFKRQREETDSDEIVLQALGQVSIIGFNSRSNAIIHICNNLEPKMRRLVLAHEFAHIIMLTEVPFKLLFQERDFPYILYNIKSFDEVMCDLFAELILLPTSTIDVIKNSYTKKNSFCESDINEFFMILSQKSQMPLYAVINCFSNYRQLKLLENDKIE